MDTLNNFTTGVAEPKKSSKPVIADYFSISIITDNKSYIYTGTPDQIGQELLNNFERSVKTYAFEFTYKEVHTSATDDSSRKIHESQRLTAQLDSVLLLKDCLKRNNLTALLEYADRIVSIDKKPSPTFY